MSFARFALNWKSFLQIFYNNFVIIIYIGTNAVIFFSSKVILKS